MFIGSPQGCVPEKSCRVATALGAREVEPYGITRVDKIHDESEKMHMQLSTTSKKGARPAATCATRHTGHCTDRQILREWLLLGIDTSSW